MDPYLHDQFKVVADLLHQKFEGEFAFFKERWWMVTRTEAGEYIWTPEGARETLVSRIGELMADLPDTGSWYRMRVHLNSRWGRNQITGAASNVFQRRDGLVIRKAPGLSPEPQAPEAEPQPTQLDH